MRVRVLGESLVAFRSTPGKIGLAAHNCNHTYLVGLATAGLVTTPVLTTLHGVLSGDGLFLFAHYRGWYKTISRSAQSLLPPKERFAGVIYNAIDCTSYPFNVGRRLFRCRHVQPK